MERETKRLESGEYRCPAEPGKRNDPLYLLHCGVERCPPGGEGRTEGRAGFRLYVILSGKGSLRVRGTRFPLHFGQMFLTRPGEEARYQADEADPWSLCWMAFDGRDALRCAEAAGFPAGVHWRGFDAEPSRFYGLVREVLDRQEPDLAGDLFRAAKLAEFLSLAIGSEYSRGRTPRKKAEDPADRYVAYAVSYLRSNYAGAKIGDAANSIGIHRSYLTGIFKQKMGVSPQVYLMQCRMRNAGALLLGSDLSVQEIARRVGYDNALTFSKIFKTYYGVSPKHYRLREQPGPASEPGGAAPDGRCGTGASESAFCETEDDKHEG